MTETGETIESRVKGLAAVVFKVDLAVVDLELGVGDIPEWDSIANLALLQAVEQRFGIALQIHEMLRIETIADIAELLSERAASGA